MCTDLAIGLILILWVNSHCSQPNTSSEYFVRMKPAVRPNQLQYLLRKAKDENYTNLYISYENLEEIPTEVLEISSIQGLFLKRNLLKSLVS